MEERVGKKLGLGANEQSNLGFVRQRLGQDVVFGEGYESIPTGTPKTIMESKNAWNYCSWLRAGWSCEKISAMAKEIYGEEISDETFRKLQVILRERDEIKPNYKATLLVGEAPRFDVIQEMRNVIALHFRRIAEIYEKEKTMQNSMGSVPYISRALQAEQDATSRDLMVLFQMEQKDKDFHLARKLKMGIIDDQEVIDIEPSKEPSEQDIKRRVSTYTNEQAYAMRMALSWAKKVYYLDLPELFDEMIVAEYAEMILAFDAHALSTVKIGESVKLQYHEYWFGMSQEIRIGEQVWVRVS